MTSVDDADDLAVSMASMIERNMDIFESRLCETAITAKTRLEMQSTGIDSTIAKVRFNH